MQFFRDRLLKVDKVFSDFKKENKEALKTLSALEPLIPIKSPAKKLF